MRQVKVFLEEYNQKALPFVTEIFGDLKQKAFSPIVLDAIERYETILWDGKHLRGGLAKLGYECVKLHNDDEIIKTSLAVEITHTFFLMHDDVMDQDDVRRGQPTIHRQYESIYPDQRSKEKASHYGETMAYNLGDFGAYLGQVVLNNSNYPVELKQKAATIFTSGLLEVVYGQMLDNTIGVVTDPTEKEVLTIHRYKTADYTGSLPMQVGAILAGAEDEYLEHIKGYGRNIGIAFQIRDDEIGLFSDPETIGKPVGSDIRQNKNTLLKVRALQNANQEDREFLNDAYGNSDLADQDVERVRQITVDSGALKYSQRMSRQYVDKAKKFIPRLSQDEYYQDLLTDFADFMVEREK